MVSALCTYFETRPGARPKANPPRSTAPRPQPAEQPFPHLATHLRNTLLPARRKPPFFAAAALRARLLGDDALLRSPHLPAPPTHGAPPRTLRRKPTGNKAGATFSTRRTVSEMRRGPRGTTTPGASPSAGALPVWSATVSATTSRIPCQWVSYASLLKTSSEFGMHSTEPAAPSASRVACAPRAHPALRRRVQQLGRSGCGEGSCG